MQYFFYDICELLKLFGEFSEIFFLFFVGGFLYFDFGICNFYEITLLEDLI